MSWPPNRLRLLDPQTEEVLSKDSAAELEDDKVGKEQEEGLGSS